jgi:hypothetical protein
VLDMRVASVLRCYGLQKPSFDSLTSRRFENVQLLKGLQSLTSDACSNGTLRT